MLTVLSKRASKPSVGFVSFLNYTLAWAILHVGTLQTNDAIHLLRTSQVKALVPFREVPAKLHPVPCRHLLQCPCQPRGTSKNPEIL